MISKTLTIVFATCKEDGTVDVAYENALNVHNLTHDCALVLGTPDHDPSLSSTHHTILVPRLDGFEPGAKHAPGLARALMRFKNTDTGGFGYFKRSTNGIFGAGDKKDVGSFRKASKNSTKARLGPATAVHLKWATDEARRKELHHEALLYTRQLRELQGVCVPRFFGYYEGLVHGEVFAVSVFEDCFHRGNFDLHGLAFAVRELHKAGAVHGALLDTIDDQLKLSKNVGVDEEGRVCLVDFTKAKACVKDGASVSACGIASLEDATEELKVVDEYVKHNIGY